MSQPLASPPDSAQVSQGEQGTLGAAVESGEPGAVTSTTTKTDRLRIVVVAALAVLVMGGVIASALVARSHAKDDDPLAGGTSPRGVGLPPAGFSRGRKPMPSGCDVDLASPPVLEVDLPEKTLKIGSLKQGEKVERTVTVRNTGSGVLCVSDVSTSCGCVHADWEGEAHIRPGSSGTVKVRVDTTGKEGLMRKVVTLFSNDPKLRGEAQFAVELDVRLGIILAAAPGMQSTALGFGTHALRHSAIAAVRLKSPKAEREWKIESVESLAPVERRTVFAWELIPVEPNDPEFRCYDLRVTHPGRATAGRDVEPLLIKTTHPERREIRVDAEIVAEAKFYASPKHAVFGFVRPSDTPPGRAIELKAAEQGVDFTVKGVRLEGKGFVAAEQRRLGPGWWVVDVHYDGEKRAAGPVGATLIVSIDDAEVSEVPVSLSASAMGELRIHAEPSRVRLGFVRPGDAPPSRAIELVPGDKSVVFRVTKAEMEGEGFVAGEPHRAGDKWVVDVRYDGVKRAQGTVAATLVVSTDDPEFPVVRVPVDAAVAGS